MIDPRFETAAAEAGYMSNREYVERQKERAIDRVAEIDRMFEEATEWGSWMVSAANEREGLASLYGLPHKHLARDSNGNRVD